ncbi:MAG: hypothetical protein M3400_03355 [Actinomycetota bacterium]|nr:hypothetical protein [Actinomycetota bacterium]
MTEITLAPTDLAVERTPALFGAASAALRRAPARRNARLCAVLDRDLTLSLGPADIAAHL